MYILEIVENNKCIAYKFKYMNACFMHNALSVPRKNISFTIIYHPILLRHTPNKTYEVFSLFLHFPDENEWLLLNVFFYTLLYLDLYRKKKMKQYSFLAEIVLSSLTFQYLHFRLFFMISQHFHLFHNH